MMRLTLLEHLAQQFDHATSIVFCTNAQKKITLLELVPALRPKSDLAFAFSLGLFHRRRRVFLRSARSRFLLLPLKITST
jgi:hypothetical protein